MSVFQLSVASKGSSWDRSSKRLGDDAIRIRIFRSSYEYVVSMRRVDLVSIITGEITWVVPRNVTRCQSLSHSAKAFLLLP